MKLNYRDKVLLTAVIVILVAVLGVVFFIKPAIEDMNDAQKELDEKSAELVKMENQIEQDKDLPQRIEAAYKEVSKAARNFYDFQEAQKATQTVDDLLEKDNLENLDMKSSGYSTMVLKPYVYAPKVVATDIDTEVDKYDGVGDSSADSSSSSNASSTASTNKTASAANQTSTAQANNFVANPRADGAGDITIGCYDIDFTFEGTVSDIKNFCDKLTSNTQKSMLISELEITDVTESKVEAKMTLQMMVLKKLSDPLKDTDKKADSADKTDSSSEKSADDSSSES